MAFVARRMMSTVASSSSTSAFKTLLLTRPKEYVVQVELNRAAKRNAINMEMWGEIKECFNQLAKSSDVRAIVLAGSGKMFCSGIDVADLSSVVGADGDVGRKAFNLRTSIMELQDSFTAIENCPKPVIAAVHSGCIGAGVDMIAACDVRLCSHDAFFEIKEVDLGLAADVGTLQRLPKIVGNGSLMRELCLTGRRFSAAEADKLGLTSGQGETREQTVALAVELAAQIAAKSPVAVQGTKINLNYSRDHTVEEGLKYMATWNMAMLQSSDLFESAAAMMGRRAPTFAKL